MSTELIPLTQGKYAVVDASDYVLLSKFKWYAKQAKHRSRKQWYAMRNEKVNGKQRTVLMHRQILAIEPEVQIDHRDGDGLNNTRSNLRLCTRSENSCNRGLSPRNKIGYKGVSFRKENGKWMAQITKNRRNFNLGYFDTPELSHAAYVAAANTLHGEFANAG